MITGWTVKVTCPHGFTFNLPLRALYSLDMELQGCDECVSERARREPTWRERRRLARELKRLERGVG